MANTRETVRRFMQVTKTPEGKGLRLDIPVVIYNNGFITVSNIPRGKGPNTRVKAIRLVTQLVEELFDKFDRRK
jgi:hypothetical protein